MNQLAAHTGINLYTDGASRGNPGRGGFGGVLVIDEQVAEFGGREDLTTNNRMELMAVIEGFRKIASTMVSTSSTTGRESVPEPVEGSIITIHTDSAYVLNGATKWIYGWQKNNWITSTKSEVLNKDLWSELANLQQQLLKSFEISWVKVKGHSGHPENERCDVIATSFADVETPLAASPELFYGSLEKYKQEILPLYSSPSKKVSSTLDSKPKKAKDSRPAFSYVSLVDGVFHADKTWGECEKRVKGTKGAKYKKVYSPGEESEMRKEWK